MYILMLTFIPEQEQPEATITFYVAECMEFPFMGEYHNNLTLEEAIKIYESIPAERMHGGKGIGFDLQDGDKDYSGEYELMCWDRVDRELIDMIPLLRSGLRSGQFMRRKIKLVCSILMWRQRG